MPRAHVRAPPTYACVGTKSGRLYAPNFGVYWPQWPEPGRHRIAEHQRRRETPLGRPPHGQHEKQMGQTAADDMAIRQRGVGHMVQLLAQPRRRPQSVHLRVSAVDLRLYCVEGDGDDDCKRGANKKGPPGWSLADFRAQFPLYRGLLSRPEAVQELKNRGEQHCTPSAIHTW